MQRNHNTNQRSTSQIQEPKSLNSETSMKQQTPRAQIPEERTPILFLDVNLGKGNVSRLTIYQGDKPEIVA